MKNLLKTKKILFWALALFALVIVWKFMFAEKFELKKQTEFVKEHNTKILALPKKAENKDIKVSETSPEKSSEKILVKKKLTDENGTYFVGSDGIKVYDSQEDPWMRDQKGFVETEDNVGRIVVKYTEPMPPVPDVEYVKNNFVDVNANGVRDDEEIDIIMEYEDDAELVEAFFAGARTKQYELYLHDNNLISKEYIQKTLDNVSKNIRCLGLYFDSSEFSENRGDFHDVITKDTYHDTKSRKTRRDKMESLAHGMIIRSINMNQESCKEFFAETKTWQLQ